MTESFIRLPSLCETHHNEETPAAQGGNRWAFWTKLFCVTITDLPDELVENLLKTYMITESFVA